MHKPGTPNIENGLVDHVPGMQNHIGIVKKLPFKRLPQGGFMPGIPDMGVG
jgi:hypothetical protein